MSARKQLSEVDDNYIVHSLNQIKLADKPGITKPAPRREKIGWKVIPSPLGGGGSKGIKVILRLLEELQIVHSTEVSFGAACHHWRPLPFDVMVVVQGKVGLIEY